LKSRGISPFPPLSLEFDWRERERMISTRFKVKVGGFRVKFVKVYD